MPIDIPDPHVFLDFKAGDRLHSQDLFITNLITG